MDGVARLASENPDLKFVIEYKPREPRVKMSYDSVSRTLLGIEKIGLPNIGILLDFGHAIYGGESAADSAQLAIDYGRLFGMDVNDNYRSWDDDLIVGSLHPIEIFQYTVVEYYTLDGIFLHYYQAFETLKFFVLYKMNGQLSNLEIFLKMLMTLLMIQKYKNLILQHKLHDYRH